MCNSDTVPIWHNQNFFGAMETNLKISCNWYNGRKFQKLDKQTRNNSNQPKTDLKAFSITYSLHDQRRGKEKTSTAAVFLNNWNELLHIYDCWPL